MISHIIERCIADIFNPFCANFYLMNTSQYVFRKGNSTTVRREDFADIVNKALNENNISVVLFLDS